MVMLRLTDNLILLYRTNTFKNISQNQKIGQNIQVLFPLVVVLMVIYCAALPYWSNKTWFLLCCCIVFYLLVVV